MRITSRMSLPAWLAGLLMVWAVSFAHGSFSGPQTPSVPEVPVARASAGPCMADFVVRDSSGKAVYDAKIGIQLQYGFMGLRKLDVTVGTNWEGKARIEGLPDRIRRTAEFKVSRGTQSQLIPYDPEGRCYAQHEVTLEEPAADAPPS